MRVFEGRIAFTGLCIGLLIILLVSLIASISFGAISVPTSQVWKIIINKSLSFSFFARSWKPSAETIVWTLRCPRTLLAIISGAGLSLCGIMMQALTRNPLANPYILGISAGASTGAVAVIILGGSVTLGIHNASLGAFIGALATSVFVFTLARQNGSFSTTRLLLIGVSISALFSSITSFLVFTANDTSKAHDALFWMIGSLSGATWEKLEIPSLILISCLVFVIVYSRALNGLLMGEETAITLGVDTKRIKKLTLCLASLLTGFLVSISGVIGFIGLIVPHIARSLVGSDHGKVALISVLLGPIILIWADVCARMFARPEEIPIGVVTAFLGAPFFMWLVKKSAYSFGGNNE